MKKNLMKSVILQGKKLKIFFSKKDKDKKDGDDDYNSIISAETGIEGKIYSPVPIKIDGAVTGEVISKKEVVIGRGGRVKANIRASNIVVEGDFTGNIIVSGEAKITSSGRLSGNVIQLKPFVTIETGGLFSGRNVITDNKEIFNKNSKNTISSIKVKPTRILKY
jgi:cytoskeletal protein CcmA (bactofilin family)